MKPSCTSVSCGGGGGGGGEGGRYGANIDRIRERVIYSLAARLSTGCHRCMPILVQGSFWRRQRGDSYIISLFHPSPSIPPPPPPISLSLNSLTVYVDVKYLVAYLLNKVVCNS